MSASENTPNSDFDYQAPLAQWLAEVLVLSGPPTLYPLGGDAGFRCYSRLGEQSSEAGALLAVYAPPDVEKNHEFVRIAQYLRDQGLLAPKILAVDYERGFLLIEDLGQTHLFDVLANDNVELLYGESLGVIGAMQQGPQQEELDVYSHDVLLREMQLLREWFIPKLLAYELSADEGRLLDETFAQLLHSALEQPQAFVHRDFHSRNILLKADSSNPERDVSLALIDFQDALWGPITYDVVSLLRDCYVYWPAAKVEQSLQQYHQLLAAKGHDIEFDCLKRWFDWMGLQRHIKVLGIFARLYLRDGKAAYLNDLPLVLRYCIEVAEAYPETKAFADWFKRVLVPLCEQQSWYKDYRTAGEDGAHLSRRSPTSLAMAVGGESA